VKKQHVQTPLLRLNVYEITFKGAATNHHQHYKQKLEMYGEHWNVNV